MSKRLAVAVAACSSLTIVGGVAAIPSAEAAQACRVDYAVTSQWAGGYQGAITLANLGDQLSSWTLRFTFPEAGQGVAQGWGGTWTSSGSTVTVANSSWNGTVGTNASVALGFIGTVTGANPAPTSFTVNGLACTGSPTTSTPATSTPATSTPATTTPATRTPTPSATVRPPTTTPAVTPTTVRPTTPTATTPTATGPAGVGPLLAFPGAVGVGSSATGGRGGAVYHVTNLNDSGAGSFRDAVGTAGRIVVFDVGGYVKLASVVQVKSNITIAGQTAPGGGIGIMGREVSFNAAKNVIVRDVRFRQGKLDPDTKKSGINLLNASQLIFDHVSIEFAMWNNIDAVGAANITVQNSIDANPIGQQFAAHTEGGPYTWYNNLFANSHNRCPLAKANTQYINNVVYNFQAGYTAGNSSGHFLHDIVGNYFITGPRTTNSSNAYYQLGNQTVYNVGNIIDGNKDGALNGSTLAVGGGGAASSTPWSANTAKIPTRSAADAYAYVVANAGALPRDQVDTLVVADVKSLGAKGSLWTDQTDTGLANSGYGTIAAGTAPTDTDKDGMPDAWEKAYGLDPGNASDAGGDFDKTGYTNVEKYADSLIDGLYPVR